MTHQPENTRALVDRVARQIARDVYGFGTAMTLARYSSEAIEEQHRKIAQAAIEAIAENTRATPLDAAQEIDTGDVVLHKPSGEQWLVAFVEGDMLCACGWPESLAPLADCTLVTRATPEARISLLHEMARSSGARASYANRALAAPSFRDALEFAAKHFNSDWPERCQSIVLCARAALRAAPPQPDTRATPLDAAQEPQAWLFRCWKPGRSSVSASVDKDDTHWWPRDEWKSVMRLPLSICGPAEVLHGEAREWHDLAPPQPDTRATPGVQAEEVKRLADVAASAEKAHIECLRSAGDGYGRQMELAALAETSATARQRFHAAIDALASEAGKAPAPWVQADFAQSMLEHAETYSAGRQDVINRLRYDVLHEFASKHGVSYSDLRAAVRASLELPDASEPGKKIAALRDDVGSRKTGEAGKAPAEPVAWIGQYEWSVLTEKKQGAMVYPDQTMPEPHARPLYVAPNAAKGPAPSLVHSAEASLGAVQRPERETER